DPRTQEGAGDTPSEFLCLFCRVERGRTSKELPQELTPELGKVLEDVRCAGLPELLPGETARQHRERGQARPASGDAVVDGVTAARSPRSAGTTGTGQGVVVVRVDKGPVHIDEEGRTSFGTGIGHAQ